MKRTLATMILQGEYRVIFDDEKKTNPYTIYKKWNECGEHGIVHRSKKLTECAGLRDCMYHITWIIEGRISE